MCYYNDQNHQDQYWYNIVVLIRPALCILCLHRRQNKDGLHHFKSCKTLCENSSAVTPDGEKEDKRPNASMQMYY